MIKPNWDIFKAKFSNNLQKNFEWFCYILFCIEFDKPKGIFRFINQTAIETNPIKVDEDTIGWQSKFYDSTLSSKKNELIKCILNINKVYPEITKLVFYSNQEWGQGRKKTKGKYKGRYEPIAKLEIDDKASELGITIDWRMSSYFESPFVSDENSSIAKHFFDSNSSVLDLIKEKNEHSKNILEQIHTKIEFNEKIIEIDRDELINKLELEIRNKKVIIVSGVGGVGKTALLKKYYGKIKDNVPIYFFKATEFNINNINELFSSYTLNEFNEAHNNDIRKIVVVDSAEKLIDIQNTDPFKELVSVFLKNDWQIIFTSRSGYLNELSNIFIDIYKITPSIFHIENLTISELEDIATKYNFQPPKDIKLLELIENPFYLNEYLKYYTKDNFIDYRSFKDSLWNKRIIKSKPKREQCFLSLALKRANEGQFFILQKENVDIQDEFVNEGILGYEISGYFITHDIYEEWALEKIIESEFRRKDNISTFFNNIGCSLPIRRCFRNWVSEKLFFKDQSLINFVVEVINNVQIEIYWKDEILVSILLSDYSQEYFKLNEKILIQNNLSLLYKATFLLRISCKEMNYDSLHQLGIKNPDLLDYNSIFTKPKGSGWRVIIKFIYEHYDIIESTRISRFIKILYDWNNDNRKGETTRFAGLIALKYYQWIEKNKVYFHDDNFKEELFEIIVNASSEIKEELTNIFEQILENNWRDHNNPYYDLSKYILSNIRSFPICGILPEYILKIANLFWYKPPETRELFFDSSIGVDKYYSIDDFHMEYYPQSAYQTPIYSLLKNSFKNTLDFIINFTNQVTQKFAESKFATNEVNQIDVYLNDNLSVKQFICDRIWCTYRGTQVAPHLLESIHMALEKILIEYGKYMKQETLESYLIYLLSQSQSASVSAVVCSIVNAYPDKTFNVASLLLKTKEFVLFDNRRDIIDRTALFPAGPGLDRKIYNEERKESNNLDHRTTTLEIIIRNYQFFRNESISEEESEERQKIIWDIFDDYYSKIPDEKNQTELDRAWILCLARMDRRKMRPKFEKIEDKIFIDFNPELNPSLQKYVDNSLKNSTDALEYMSLRTWASYKIKDDINFKKVDEYEKNPSLAIEKLKKLLKRLDEIRNKQRLNKMSQEDANFYFMNKDIPPYVCSVLIKDHLNMLLKKDKILCKKIIIENASSFLNDDYRHQIMDGVDASIFVLPLLLKEYPNDKAIIKKLLILCLMNSYSIGLSGKFSDNAIKAILKYLWGISFDDANSILYGYVLLKEKYEAIRDKLRRENYKKGITWFAENIIADTLIKDNESIIKDINENEINFKNITSKIESQSLSTLIIAFWLIPLGTENNDHKLLLKSIINVFSIKLLKENNDEIRQTEAKREFIERYSYILLKTKKEEIKDYLNPFLDNFKCSEVIADLLQQIIIAEDSLNEYERFWEIWRLFEEKIINLCKNDEQYRFIDKIIKSYLFASITWNENASEWHSLNEANKEFFVLMAEQLGHCPSTLFSLSKLLYGIGSKFLNDGIKWISKIISSNNNLSQSELNNDTIYYLEGITKRFIYHNREYLRRNIESKKEVLVILDFLIEKGSVIGYLLRENIL